MQLHTSKQKHLTHSNIPGLIEFHSLPLFSKNTQGPVKIKRKASSCLHLQVIYTPRAQALGSFKSTSSWPYSHQPVSLPLSPNYYSNHTTEMPGAAEHIRHPIEVAQPSFFHDPHSSISFSPRSSFPKILFSANFLSTDLSCLTSSQNLLFYLLFPSSSSVFPHTLLNRPTS